MKSSRREVLGTITTAGVVGYVSRSNTASQEETNQKIGFPLEFAWDTEFSGVSHHVSRSEETVFVGVGRESIDDQIIALDLMSGREQWTIDVSSIVGTPIYDSDSNYVFTSVGNAVAAYDYDTQEQVWQTQLQYETTYYIVHPFEDFVLAENYEIDTLGRDRYEYRHSQLVALDKSTGEIKWRIESQTRLILVGETDDTLYLSQGADVFETDPYQPLELTPEITALDKETKDERWTSPPLEDFETILDGFDQGIVWLATNGRASALDSQTGDTYWETQLTPATPSSVGQAGPYGFVLDESDTITAFAASDGEIVWQQSYEESSGQFAVTEDTLINQTDSGFQCIDTVTGEVIDTYSIVGPVETVYGDVETVAVQTESGIHLYHGQRYLTDSALDDARGIGLLHGSVLATVSGYGEKLTAAEIAFEERQYSRAQELAESAERRGRLITGGAGIAVLGLIGSIGAGTYRHLQRRKYWNQIQTDYETTVKKAVTLQDTLPEYSDAVEHRIEDGAPDQYESLDDARQAVTDLDRFLEVLDNYATVRDQITELQKSTDCDIWYVINQEERLTVEPSTPVIGLDQDVDRLQTIVEATAETLRQKTKVEQQAAEVGSAADDYDWMSAVDQAEQALREGDLDQIRDAQESLSTINTTLEMIEQRQQLVARIDSEGRVAGINQLQLQNRIEAEPYPADVSGAVDRMEIYDDLVTCIERIAVVVRWESRVATDDIVDNINSQIEKNEPDSDLQAKIAEQVNELETLREAATQAYDALDDLCSAQDSQQTTPEVNELETELHKALVAGDAEQVDDISKRLQSMVDATWELNDVIEFDWQEFENLVARLYEDKGYDTRVTQRADDRGIDIIAENGQNQLIIQAKRHSFGNNVGRPTVQKTIGALSGTSANMAVIVTTAGFTQSAKEEAGRHIGRIKLVNGPQLISELNKSHLTPVAYETLQSDGLP
ncbi:restriction endonuclease [Natronococcus occultus]|uniref:Restriction endonuclease n=1 Tax=Natronococcus occultus SP4 TaxID=694430 RepID=L0JXI3_9EURY|nr:restriction endonuclease [Natronococcus occultus]AGB37015.1 restriction endonuclease [Natronococcus occultus SP4]